MIKTGITKKDLDEIELNSSARASIDSFLKARKTKVFDEKIRKEFEVFFQSKISDVEKVLQYFAANGKEILNKITIEKEKIYNDYFAEQKNNIENLKREYESKISKFNWIIYLQKSIFDNFIDGGCDPSKAAHATAMMLSDLKKKIEECAQEEIGRVGQDVRRNTGSDHFIGAT